MSENQNIALLFEKLTSYDKAVSFTRRNRLDQSKHNILEVTGLRHKKTKQY